MIRKGMIGWISLLLVFSLLACQTTTTTKNTVLLPDLTNTSKATALAILSAYPFTVEVEDIPTNDVPNGRFVGYGNNLEKGMEVSRDAVIVLYFAVSVNQLPDLTGKTLEQAFQALLRLNVIIRSEYEETNEVQDNYFVRYGNNRQAGDIVSNGAEVVIYIAKPLILVEYDLMISMYLEGSGFNRALEIYNYTNHTVDLSKYQLGFYLDGSEMQTQTIALTGTLGAKQSLVLVHELADEALKTKADLIVPDLYFNGNDTITIEFYNGVIVDQLGVMGWGLFYLHDQTLLRKPSINEPTSDFSITEWDLYAKDQFQLVGLYPKTYPTTFTFDTHYLTIPFSEPGGMIQVSFVSNNDGDTAQFTPGFTYENRVRFIGIDTPEMSSGDPVALQARTYVYNRLRNATTIYLQHDPKSGFIESYGRYLALIWVDGSLLNYELVYYGYSQNNYQDSSQSLIFAGVALSQWMSQAEARAKQLRLGVWGS